MCARVRACLCVHASVYYVGVVVACVCVRAMVCECGACACGCVSAPEINTNSFIDSE